KGEDDRYPGPEYVDERRELLRRWGVDLGLALGCESEPGVVLESVLHRRELRSIDELEDHRRESDPAERLHHLLRIPPDLRIEGGSPGVEHADDGPVSGRKAQRLA